MTSRFFAAGALLCLALAATAAQADDVTDQINEALAAYQRHDLATAATALDAAANLMRQAKAETWKAMLPEPLSGWTADPAESTAVGTAMFGGGTTVSRSYHKGDQSVEIGFVADAPLVQGLGSLMSSGMMTGTDAKLIIVDGRKVTYTKSDNSYTTMAGKVLVTVKGQAVEEATLKEYLRAIKFADLEKASAS